MATSENHDKLLQSLAMLIEGQLSVEDQQLLESLLLEDRVARRLYLDQLILASYLEIEHRTNDQLAQFEQATPTSVGDFSIVEKTPSRSSWDTLYDLASNYAALSMLVSAIFLAILLLSMGLIVPGQNSDRPHGLSPSIEFVAEITNTYQATFDETSDGNFTSPSMLSGDHLVLNNGLAEVTFKDGAVALLEGPALLVIDSAGAGTLMSGNTLCQVPRQAVGFTIHTTAASFVDLSTEFAVDVNEADIAVHVVAGVVRAEPHAGNTRDAIKLAAGESLRFDGQWSRFATPANEQRRLRSISRRSNTKMIQSVSVVDVSSELTGGAFDRRAEHLVDNSGLTRMSHSPFPDAGSGGTAAGTMWLSAGTLREPRDPLPVHVTFDLGDGYELTRLHIWNYNEQLRGLHSRGAHEVEIHVSPTADPQELVKLEADTGNFEFPRADGTTEYRGFSLLLDGVTNSAALENVRLVRFTILSTHGENPQEDVEGLAGLSEVRFFGIFREQRESSN